MYWTWEFVFNIVFFTPLRVFNSMRYLKNISNQNFLNSNYEYVFLGRGGDLLCVVSDNVSITIAYQHYNVSIHPKQDNPFVNKPKGPQPASPLIWSQHRKICLSLNSSRESSVRPNWAYPLMIAFQAITSLTFISSNKILALAMSQCSTFIALEHGILHTSSKERACNKSMSSSRPSFRGCWHGWLCFLGWIGEGSKHSMVEMKVILLGRRPSASLRR